MNDFLRKVVVPVERKDWFYNIFIFWLISFLLLMIERGIFFRFYYVESRQLEIFSKKEIFFAFLWGIRYDMAVIPIWVFPYHVLLFLAYYCYKKIPFITVSLYHWISYLLFLGEMQWISFLSMSNLSSILNYGVNNKHLGWEYFAYFRDLPLLIRSVYSKNPEVIVGMFLFLFFWIGISIVVVQIIRKTSLYTSHTNISFFSIIHFIFYLILNIIFLRGGIQQNPLRPADALTSTSNFINNLKLNGIFTIIHDATDKDDFKIYIDVQKNISFVRKFLQNADMYVSLKYPLMRYMKPRKLSLPYFRTYITHQEPGKQFNIILIILESWSAKFLKIHGYKQNVVPNLNRLIDKGIFFKNFYASGGRSANGIFCILTGIPDRAGRTIFRSNQIFNRFGSLPFLLKEKGYTTIFVHSGDLQFDNLRTVLPHLGFEVLIGKREMEKTNRYKKRWSMGFFDEDLYDMAFRVWKQQTKPVFMTIFTSNNHHPYTIPDKKFEVFSEKELEAKFKNSYYYADYSLGKFIDRIYHSHFIKNTIVLMVADHTHHKNLNYYQDRQIPFLIYAPYLFRPEIRMDVASQLDLLPTILALVGGNTLYSSIGRDLTLPLSFYSFQPYAFFAGGSNTDIIGMIEFPFIFYHYFHSKEKYLFRIDTPIRYQNLANQYLEVAERMDFITKNLYQISRYLEKENRVWPDSYQYKQMKRKYIQTHQ